MPRSIPKLSTLAIALTAGCGGKDPIIGDWDGIYFAVSGYTPLDLPYTTEITTESGVFDYTLSLTARFTESNVGDFVFHERFEQGGEVAFEEDYAYVFDMQRRARGVWLVDAPTYDGLLLECTARKQSLGCIGDDEVGAQYEMDFIRREE